MYSVVLDEQVLSLQYAEPEVTPEVQAVAQAGGAAITEITSGTITVNNPGDGTRGIELPQVLGTGASPTFANITTPGLADVSQLKVGGNETIKEIDFGTVAANPGSIAAQTRGSVDVTITGVRVGDIVLMNPPDGLNAGLVYGGCRVTADDTVRIYLANITAGAIDDGSFTYDWIWFDIT